MITKIVLGASLLTLSFLQTCETVQVNASPEIEGDWILKQVFLSDAYDSPCGYDAKDVSPITLTIKKEENDYVISGKSAVNHYFGTLKFKTGSVTAIEMGAIGSTKMAGSPELMNCETRYYDMLNSAAELAVNEEGKLLIGNLRKADSHPRDGGTYLIFEKAKK